MMAVYPVKWQQNVPTRLSQDFFCFLYFGMACPLLCNPAMWAAACPGERRFGLCDKVLLTGCA